MKRMNGVGRHLVIDLTPLRRSRDFRFLFAGQLVTVLGGQLATVAVPYQIYALTRSTLDVGLASLAQVLPLIAGALLGGSLADAVDRRQVMVFSQLLMALCSVGLAVNADLGAALWPLSSCLPRPPASPPAVRPRCRLFSRIWSAGPR